MCTAAPAALSRAYFPLKQHKRALGQHQSSLSDHLLGCTPFLKGEKKPKKKSLKKRNRETQTDSLQLYKKCPRGFSLKRLYREMQWSKNHAPEAAVSLQAQLEDRQCLSSSWMGCILLWRGGTPLQGHILATHAV